MNDSVYIVTGGNAGLGLECAKALARLPQVTVIIASRSLARGQAAVDELKSQGGDAVAVELDLASLASVRKCSGEILKLRPTGLTGLVCNAGIQEIGAPSRTQEGFESTFGVNHLAHFLLAQLLLPGFAENGRILFVSSGTHDPKEKSGLPAPRYTSALRIARDFEPGRIAGLRRYTTSKLCNVYCAHSFAEKLAESKDSRLRSLRVNAFDPGMMPGTGLARQYPAPLRFAWTYIMPALTLMMRNVHSTRKSGERLARLATDSAITENGKYFSDGREMRSSELSYDRANAEDLWKTSWELTGL